MKSQYDINGLIHYHNPVVTDFELRDNNKKKKTPTVSQYHYKTCEEEKQLNLDVKKEE